MSNGKTLNLEVLDKLSAQDLSSLNQKEQLSLVKSMRNELQNTQKDVPDPDTLLYQNIERANKLLDLIENMINENNNQDDNDSQNKKKWGQGSSKARLFEVAAQLINSITTATGSITGIAQDDFEQEYKLEVLKLKQKELDIKQALSTGKSKNNQNDQGNTTNNNIIVTNREDIMKLIKGNEANE